MMRFLRRFNPGSDPPEIRTTQPVEDAGPIRRNVLLIVHNPVMRTEANRLLSEILGWNDPGQLAADFIQDLKDCSYGVADFRIVERLDVDEFPIKADGFQYTEEGFLRAWRSRSGFHEPDGVDYPRLVAQFGMLERVRGGEIDEVWLFAFPYAGYYESIMAGPGAFWCNAPPLADTESSQRRFVIMGFNYERGVGEMLESFGHRAESIMTRVYAGFPRQKNLWQRFVRYDQAYPDQAEVGNVHFAPNSQRDYDWGNPRRVPSQCDDWYHFPDLRGRERLRIVDSREWGGGDIRRHHQWWYRHFPHVTGETEGVLNNWWAYVLDPNLVE